MTSSDPLIVSKEPKGGIYQALDEVDRVLDKLEEGENSNDWCWFCSFDRCRWCCWWCSKETDANEENDDVHCALVSYVQEVQSKPEGRTVKNIIVSKKDLLLYKDRQESNRSSVVQSEASDVETEPEEPPNKLSAQISISEPIINTTNSEEKTEVHKDEVGVSEAHSSPMLASPRNGTKSATPSPVTSVAKRNGARLNPDWHDEDLDRIGSLQNRGSLSTLGARSDSMASVYSGAGEGRYGTVAVRGQVEFGLQYNYKAGALEIQIKQCKDLAPVDTKRNRSDPYVKVYLLPDKSKSGKRKTKVKKHTLNPVFDECLKFHISLNGLESRTLWLTVWHSDMFGRNDFLGEVMMTLENKVFDDPTPKWYNLQERTEPFEDVSSYKGDIIVCLKFIPPDMTTEPFEDVSSYKGDIIVCLKFIPPDMTVQKKGKRSRGALHVLVKEAKSLTAVKANGTSDPFCKSYLLPDKGRSSKQKTPVAKRTTNPVWNYTFIYDDVTLQELAERCLELTVWDHDRLASNEFLGGVRFSLGTGKHYGKPVDWMDASGRELSLWKNMLEKPNFWVEGSLSLRSSLESRGS
uniref:Synaptotagmin-like protein 5 n=1 Tax=Diabrotica virgifera virgifera TaxID=50390 RepID=A0A6P7H1C2_DIAVI